MTNIHTIKIEINDCYTCRSEKTLGKIIDTHLCDEMAVKTVKLELSVFLCARCRSRLLNSIRAKYGPGQKIPTAEQLKYLMHRMRFPEGATGPTGVTGPTESTSTPDTDTGPFGPKRKRCRPSKKLGVGGRSYSRNSKW